MIKYPFCGLLIISLTALCTPVTAQSGRASTAPKTEAGSERGILPSIFKKKTSDQASPTEKKQASSRTAYKADYRELKDTHKEAKSAVKVSRKERKAAEARERAARARAAATRADKRATKAERKADKMEEKSGKARKKQFFVTPQNSPRKRTSGKH